MRAPKALLIPFKFREGYPDSLVDPLIASAVELVARSGVDYTLTESVVTDADADLVAGGYVPAEYDFTVMIMPTWFEPVTAVRAARPYFGKPIVVWGFGNFMHEGCRTNLGSSAGAGVTKGTLREYGVNHEYIYYSPDAGRDEEISAKLRKVANVARAMTLMASSRILSVGYQFGGMTIGDMDLTKMRRVFGPDLVELDSYTLISRMQALSPQSKEYLAARTKIISMTKGTIGPKADGVARMYAVLRQFVDETRAEAVTLKCHFALSQEYGLSACIPLSVIGTEVVASCEADIPLTLTQLLMHYLSGGEQTTYADTHELRDNKVLFGACGFAPAGMCCGGDIVCQLPAANPVGLGATFGDYITNKNWLKEGRLTIARILKEPDGGFTLHASSGFAVGEIGSVAEYGSPQYSFTDVVLDCELDSFAQHSGSHHYALCYSELKDALELYCKYTGIAFLKD